ncbi:hypothetical protein EDB84DRAFT_1680692 [Lactarius hengduanensis]|nr:hypothetical protein EDB84DRAFT_1680692 [Lactarius hengduanensis]
MSARAPTAIPAHEIHYQAVSNYIYSYMVKPSKRSLEIIHRPNGERKLTNSQDYKDAGKQLEMYPGRNKSTYKSYAALGQIEEERQSTNDQANDEQMYGSADRDDDLRGPSIISISIAGEIAEVLKQDSRSTDEQPDKCRPKGIADVRRARHVLELCFRKYPAPNEIDCSRGGLGREKTATNTFYDSWKKKRISGVVLMAEKGGQSAKQDNVGIRAQQREGVKLI